MLLKVAWNDAKVGRLVVPRSNCSLDVSWEEEVGKMEHLAHRTHLNLDADVQTLDEELLLSRFQCSHQEAVPLPVDCRMRES